MTLSAEHCSAMGQYFRTSVKILRALAYEGRVVPTDIPALMCTAPGAALQELLAKH